MGMFSWACKGCGHDLKPDELVRMNGRKGNYDGYGGNGAFDWEDAEDDSEPACWHERCYRKATEEERADKTPSENADNQGFGYPALAFLPGYNERRKNSYRCIVSVWEESKRREYHLVKSEGELILKDKEEYDSAWENYADYEFPENYDDMSEEDHKSFMQGIKEKFEASTGLKNPLDNEIHFDSLEEAKRSVMPLLFLMESYSLVILGRQGKIEGQCYARERWKSGKDGLFQDDVEYDHDELFNKGVA